MIRHWRDTVRWHWFDGSSGTRTPQQLEAGAIAGAVASIPGGTSYPFGVVAKSSNYTMDGSTDGVVEVDCTAGDVLITLPPAAGPTAAVHGFPYHVKRVSGGAHTVNVVGQAGATIDGAAGNQPMITQWQSMVVQFDGTNWIVIALVKARHAPVASFTFVTSVPLTATFTNTSTDPDGDAMTYAWAFGDGGTSSATSPAHTYSAAGSYTVTLVVTDATGLSSQVSQSVTVSGTTSAERRPFSPTLSPWNKTAVQLYPAGVPVVAPALNDKYIGMDGTTDEGIINRSGQAPYTFWGSDTTQFTIAVYIITPAMIAASHPGVASSGIHCESSDSSTTYVTTTAATSSLPFGIPAGSKPAAGGDGQFTFWDRDNLLGNGGEFWDFYQVVVDGSGNWVPDGSGRVQCQNFSHFVGEIGSDGVPATTPKVYASRGPGIPYLTGLIRKWEIDAGLIQHPIAVAWDQPANTFTYPACKSDGSSVISADAPEGALLLLKSSFPVQDVENPVAKTIATAMQQYGCRCADNSGTSKLYAQDDNSVGLGANWGGALIADVMGQIPIYDFFVVDPNGTSSTRETDLRIDYSGLGTDDPIGTLPVLIEAVTGSSTGGGNVTAINSALATGDLLLCLVSMKGTNGQAVTSVSGASGAGGTWKPIRRFVEPRGISQNLSHEIWLSRATSGTPGTVTVVAGSVSTTVVQLVRLTVNSTVRKIFSVGRNDAAPTNKIRGTTDNSLVLQFVTARNATLSADAGATGVNLNTSAGAGGTIIKSSILTRPGSGDITGAPTMSASIEYLTSMLEIT